MRAVMLVMMIMTMIMIMMMIMMMIMIMIMMMMMMIMMMMMMIKMLTIGLVVACTQKKKSHLHTDALTRFRQKAVPPCHKSSQARVPDLFVQSRLYAS